MQEAEVFYIHKVSSLALEAAIQRSDVEIRSPDDKVLTRIGQDSRLDLKEVLRGLIEKNQIDSLRRNQERLDLLEAQLEALLDDFVSSNEEAFFLALQEYMRLANKDGIDYDATEIYNKIIALDFNENSDKDIPLKLPSLRLKFAQRMQNRLARLPFLSKLEQGIQNELEGLNQKQATHVIISTLLRTGAIDKDGNIKYLGSIYRLIESWMELFGSKSGKESGLDSDSDPDLRNNWFIL